jgi:hypothetical protein
MQFDPATYEAAALSLVGKLRAKRLALLDRAHWETRQALRAAQTPIEATLIKARLREIEQERDEARRELCTPRTGGLS